MPKKKPVGLGPQVIFSGPSLKHKKLGDRILEMTKRLEAANRDLESLAETPLLDRALDAAKKSAVQLSQALQGFVSEIMNTIRKGQDKADSFGKMLSDTGSSLRSSFNTVMKGCDDYAKKINNFDWSKISQPIKSFFSGIAETITKTLRNLVKSLKIAFNVELKPAAEMEMMPIKPRKPGL